MFSSIYSNFISFLLFTAIFDQETKQIESKPAALSNIDKLLSTLATKNTSDNKGKEKTDGEKENHKRENELAGNNAQILSVEALQLLNDLPNISFMRSNHLMFPINKDTARH